jgi:hypothetical protein
LLGSGPAWDVREAAERYVKLRVKVPNVPSTASDGIAINMKDIEPRQEILLPGEFIELYDGAGKLWVGRVQVTNYLDKTAWVDTRWAEYLWDN